MYGHECGALIKHIHCAMQKNANNELRATGLTFSQVHLLFTLREQPEGCCSLKELERLMGVAQSTTVGIVKRCGEKGFVECFGDTDDRRAKFVRVTGTGLDVCRDTEANIHLAEDRMLKYLTDGEKAELSVLLAKVYRAVSEPPDHPQSCP
ncbi:MAG: MarR family winged helix-turn-helix transcriptional regulator [Candidatus Enterenecus sp.]